MYWDVGMSEERFGEFRSRILRILYGDAAAYVDQYISLSDLSYECGPCRHAWNGFTIEGPENGPFNRETLAATFDTTFDLLETAISLADTGAEEARLTKLQCSNIFMGCLSAYQYAIEAGDEPRMRELEARYALIDERLGAYGLDMSAGLPDYTAKHHETELAAYFAG